MDGDRNERPRGRVIKFIDAGVADFPVRDVEGNYKKHPATEPYIEYGLEKDENDGRIIGAENYYSCCYQKGVKKVVDNKTEYLFLASYPHHDRVNATENLIIGYIHHEKHEWRNEDRVAVIGHMKIYRFDDGIPLSDLGYEPASRSLSPYGLNLDEEQTEEVITHFNAKSDVTEKSLEKVLELEGKTTVASSGYC